MIPQVRSPWPWRPLAALGIALVAAGTVDAAQLEVRAGRGVKDFRVRQSGRDLAVREARYVPPVGEWRNAPGAAEETRIYIATEVSPNRLRTLLASLACLLSQPLPPQVLISVGGLPFTSDTAALREALKKIPDAITWTGTGWKGELPEAMDPRMFRPDHRQSRSFALHRYADLVEKLSRYPGKKIVVLFHMGFGVGPETMPFLESLALKAFRNRITFHTLSTRRSEAAAPARRMGLHQLARATGGTFQLDRFPSVMDRSRDTFTGGLPTIPLDVNPCSLDPLSARTVLQAYNSAGDYHLLTYSGGGDALSGVLGLEVTAGEDSTPVRVLPEYFSENSGTAPLPPPGGGFGSLHSLLETADADSVPFQVRFTYSPRYDQSLLAASINVRASEVGANKVEAGVWTDFTLLVRGLDLEAERLPYYSMYRFHELFPRERWETLVDDPRAFLQVNLAMRIPPGKYRWEMAVRDDLAGTGGVLRREVTVPGFRGPSAYTQPLLSMVYPENQSPAGGLVARGGGAGAKQIPRRLYQRIAAAEKNRRFAAPPDGVFRRGETIFVQHVLNHPSKEETRAAKRLTVGVFAEGASKPSLVTKSRGRLVREDLPIFFETYIATQKLEPGKYRVRTSLKDERGEWLEAGFQLVVD